jgi:hypothetical protein
MTPCPDDPTLLAYATGDGDAETRAHARRCLRCAGRLQALRADLAVLRDVLADGPLPTRVAHAPAHRARPAALHWGAPLAAAAMLVLALAWWRATPPATPTAAPQLATLTDDVSAALFASREGLRLSEPLADHEMLAAALNGGFPCDAGSAYGSGCSYADLLDQ